MDSIFNNHLKLNPLNLKNTDKAKGKDIFFNKSNFINLCREILNIDDNLLIYDKYNLISLDNISLNISKSYILEIFSKLMDKLNQYNVLDELDNLTKYLKSLTNELITRYSQVNHLFAEKIDNTKEEEIILKHYVKILDYFNISIITRISISIFSENSIE